VSTRTDSTQQACGLGGEQARLLTPTWPLFAGLGPLGALPTVPRLARAFSALVLAGCGLGDLTEDCELIISELTANVIRAATGPDGHPRYDDQGRLPLLWLRLLADHTRLRIEVLDNLAPEIGEPAQRHARATDETGRGLEIIDGLSQDWGWDYIPGHDAKRVWALLARS
jgi:hypothetical protein